MYKCDTICLKVFDLRKKMTDDSTAVKMLYTKAFHQN